MKIDFKDRIYILDGAMGTELQKAGMRPGEDQNDYLLAHPDVVEDIHRRYAEAGSDILYAPTFSVNRHRIAQRGDLIEEDIRRLMEPAGRVKARFASGTDGQPGREILVALDLGPLGEMLEPMGDLPFETAYETYRRLVLAGVGAGADLIVIETMTDLYEVKAAALAARENSDLPVIVSMSFEEGGRTFTGTSIEAMVVCLQGLGVDAMGINCSLGPDQIYPMIRQMQDLTDLPVFAKPNAGLPDPATGTYDITPDQFARAMRPFAQAGASLLGGCCGTAPDYIRKLKEEVESLPAGLRDPAGEAAGRGKEGPAEKDRALKVSSRSRVVTVDHVTVIGERLNPTGKKRMKQALLEGDYDYILTQAIDQIDAGAEILDVNVGLPGLDEAEAMPQMIKRLQAITDLPLQIDSSDPQAIEAGLRVYNGKPIVNSVNGEREVLDRILPLVKKYGAAVIGLTLDEKGIPATAEERLAIAERILARARDYGIPDQDVIIDCLTLTASAQQKEVNETLRAVRMVRDRLGLHAALGVSNVSFGLPLRPVINRTFFIMAMENGLDLPIINPNDVDMMASIHAFNVLKNVDETGEVFIGKYSDKEAIGSIVPRGTKARMAGSPGRPSGTGPAGGMPAAGAAGGGPEPVHDIFRSIERGLEAETMAGVDLLLQDHTEMEVVDKYMIPALDRVGRRFEEGTLFLPQMLQAAAAAQAGFEVIRDRLAQSDRESVSLGDVVIATVRGDIHDIGKNIVKTIMDNYGFHMIDLGKNVPAEEIVDVITRRQIRLLGLSALMTTTLQSMAETIAAVKEAAPDCRIMVGGAVLTEDYARSIGADYYCRDAMQSVEAAQEVFGGRADGTGKA